MKSILLLVTFLAYAYCADTLINALTQGTFEKKIQLVPTTDEDESKADLSKQRLFFHYTSAPLKGMQVEVQNDGLIASVKALYNAKVDDLNYSLSANSYTSNTTAYAMGIMYNLKSDIAIGSRYTLKNENSNFSSYSEFYTTLYLNEVSKGLNIGLSYDKMGSHNEGEKVNLKIKSPFDF